MTRALRFGLALLLGLLALAPVAQAASGVQAVVFDRIERVDPSTFQFSIPCQDMAEFVPVAGGFRFEERQPGTAPAGGTPYPGGYLALGCGEARLDRLAPVGARSVQVRFQGDRGVDEFNVAGTTITRPGRQFDQELRFQSGATDRRVSYYEPAAGPLPLGLVAPDAFLAPAGVDAFTLTWSFRDSSYFVGQSFPDVLSGQAFSATVQDVVLRFPDLPLEHAVRDSNQRQGELLVETTRVTVPIADATAGDLRVQVAHGLTFDSLRAPDGTRITTQTTRITEGPDGFNRTAILVESLDQGTEVTVPQEVLARFGPGTYALTFTGVDAVQTHTWFLPFVILILLAPLPFALLAYHHVRRFELEAFGGFRRSARNLRVALVVLFLYYLAVLVGHFLGSRLILMTAWPLPFEALVLYVQVGIAVAAFLALFAVARELYHITVPRDLPAVSSPDFEDPE